MDRIDALHAFVLAVDHGSLAAAARELGRSAASITRAIDALEERAGTALLARTTRSLKLTEAGARYLDVARRVIADLDAVDQATTATAREPQGLLTVTAPVVFGAIHVRPILDALLASHPKLRVRALFLDRAVSLVEEGVDVAVRIGHLADSALVATAVGSVRRVVVASPDYLAAHGRPRAPGDLARHRCLAATAITPHDAWSFAGRRGARAVRVKVSPAMSVNAVDAAIRSALDGVGVTAVLSYQVADHLERGTLVRLLASYEPASVPVHVIAPAATVATAKVRAFVDRAVPRLREVLGRSAPGGA